MSRTGEMRVAVAACAFGAFGVIVGALVDVVTWFQGTLTANVAADLALAPVGLLIAFARGADHGPAAGKPDRQAVQRRRVLHRPRRAQRRLCFTRPGRRPRNAPGRPRGGVARKLGLGSGDVRSPRLPAAHLSERDAPHPTMALDLATRDRPHGAPQRRTRLRSDRPERLPGRESARDRDAGRRVRFDGARGLRPDPAERGACRRGHLPPVPSLSGARAPPDQVARDGSPRRHCSVRGRALPSRMRAPWRSGTSQCRSRSRASSPRPGSPSSATASTTSTGSSAGRSSTGS